MGLAMAFFSPFFVLHSPFAFCTLPSHFLILYIFFRYLFAPLTCQVRALFTLLQWVKRGVLGVKEAIDRSVI